MGGRNSGPRPKPAALKTLQNARHRPGQTPEEPTIPEPAATIVERPTILPPPGMTRAERRFWDYFAPLLAGAKVLTPADIETLADYCRACRAVDDRGKQLRKAYRPLMTTTADGTRIRSAIDQRLVRMLDSQMRGWMERKTKLAGELGLTAISRTRVAWSGHPQIAGGQSKGAAPAKPQSKLAQLQEQAASLRRPVGVK